MRQITLYLLTSVILAVQVNAQVQWGDEGSSDVPVLLEDSSGGETQGVQSYGAVRLTFDGAISRNPRVVANSDLVFVVWEDTRDGNREVYWQNFDRATGQPAASPVRVTNTGENSDDPSIGIDGSGNSYVVWLEGPPYGTVHGAVIGLDGSIVVAPIPLGHNLAMNPDVAVSSSGIVWVSYERWSASDHNVYLRQFDNALTYVCQRSYADVSLPPFEKFPAIAVRGSGRGDVAWRDMNMYWQDGIYMGYASTSCGGGGTPLRAGEYDQPGVGWSGQWNWIAARLGANLYNIYGSGSAFRINDVSGTVVSRGRVGDDPNYSYAVWADTRDGNSEIYLSRASGNTAYTDIRLTDHPATSQNPDIASYSPEPGKWWVVWQDDRDGNLEIYLTGSDLQPPQAHIVIEPTSCQFEVVQNGPAPASQQLSVTNAGSGLFEWESESDQPWLHVVPAIGSGDGTIEVSIATTDLAPGTYSGVITVSSFGADNSPETAEVTLTVTPGSGPSIIVYDGADPAAPMANTSCALYAVHSDDTETFLGNFDTDAFGGLTIDPTDFLESDEIKVSVVSHTRRSQRPDHTIEIEGVDHALSAHNIFVDNGTFEPDGALRYDQYANMPNQAVYLRHTTVRINLVASVEWDVGDDVDYLANLEDAFRMVANYLYDVTDGQVTLDTVVIYDCGYDTDENSPTYGRWQTADIQFRASNRTGKENVGASPHGYLYDIYDETTSRNGRAYLNRVLYFDNGKANADLCIAHYPYDWTIPSTRYGDDHRFRPGVRAIAHELAHYFWFFGEEYEPFAGYATPTAHDFGLMGSVTRSGGLMGSEMSSSYDYPGSGYQTTHHWVLWRQMNPGWASYSCWDVFEQYYEGPQTQDDWGGCFRRIIRPDDADGAGQPFPGPNNDLEAPNVNVGSEVTVIVHDQDRQALVRLMNFTAALGVPADYANVELRKADENVVIQQGFTNHAGSLHVLGSNCDDVVFAHKKTVANVLGHEVVVSEWEVEQTIAQPCLPARDDEGYRLRRIAGLIPVVPTVLFTDETNLRASFCFERQPPAIPDLELVGGASSQGPVTMTEGTESFFADLALPVAHRGMLLVTSIDDSGRTFFIPANYQYERPGIADAAGPSRFSSDDEVLAISVDTNSGTVEAAFVLSCDFPSMTGGLNPGLRQIGNIYAVAVAETGGGVRSEVDITFRYRPEDLMAMSPESLVVGQWSPSEQAWNLLATQLDPARTEIHAVASGTGTYGLFVPAAEIGGDIAISPQPMYCFYANAVGALPGAVYIGNLHERSVSAIDPEGLVLSRANGSVRIDSTGILSFHEGFEDSVLAVYFDVREFVRGFGVLWDTTRHEYRLSGALVSGQNFSGRGQVTMIGHRRGDLNSDGLTNVRDLTLLILYLFKSGPPPALWEAADMNADGLVDIRDFSELVQLIFR